MDFNGLGLCSSFGKCCCLCAGFYFHHGISYTEVWAVAAAACVWRSDENIMESVILIPSSHIFRDPIQVIRPDSRFLHPLIQSHFALLYLRLKPELSIVPSVISILGVSLGNE